MIQRAIKEKYPEIKVVGTVGPNPDDKDWREGWAFARETKPELVDEHYYRPPQWFLDNLHRYDNYDRSEAKVYVGNMPAAATLCSMQLPRQLISLRWSVMEM